jgi:ferric-dicitrate binding protein FerR (iron transport regulator)
MKPHNSIFSLILQWLKSFALTSPEKINRVISRENIMQFASEYKTPDPVSDEIALGKLMERIKDKRILTPAEIKNNRLLYYAAIAASILLLAGIKLTFFNHTADIKVTSAIGQLVTVYLPDSSEITLNSASSLSYNSKQWKNKRVVKLNGEAFFKIKKGKRFEVECNRCVVTVLGTSFNIFERDNGFKVSCFTGKVSVKVKKNSFSRLITPGYETSLGDNNTLTEPGKFIPQETASWQKGTFCFHNEKLINVINELKRQFNISIKYTDVSGRTFTGCFFRNNLDEALKLVCYPMQLDYTIHGNNVLIKNKLTK